MTEREQIEAGVIWRPDGVGTYISEGAEVSVWENTIDPGYVIKVRRRHLPDFGLEEAAGVNRARWSRKQILSEALSAGQQAIRVARTYFFEGFLWQERIGITLARLMARHNEIWERIGGDFLHRLPAIQAVAKNRMRQALVGQPPEVPYGLGDGLANSIRVDDHYFHFAVRLSDGRPDDTTIACVYLIDW